eukprot:scaffold8700_cov62-Phaeocystis_antarctica.AAC.5
MLVVTGATTPSMPGMGSPRFIAHTSFLNAPAPIMPFTESSCPSSKREPLAVSTWKILARVPCLSLGGSYRGAARPGRCGSAWLLAEARGLLRYQRRHLDNVERVRHKHQEAAARAG